MKVIVFTLFSACLTLALCLFLFGCTTTQQTTAYKTIGSVEVSAVAAYDGYCTLVIQGTVPTNSVPQVAAAYNQLQSDALLAASVASQGTNAIATTNLLTDLTQLTSVVTTASQIK
jgi:hypothetical protein